MNLWLSTLLITISCGSLAVIEVLKRKFNISSEYTRRISHCIIGTMGVFGYLLGPIWLYAAVVGVLAVLLFVLRQKNVLTSITNVKRKSYGDIFLPLGLLVAIPFAAQNSMYYVASILIMTYADSLCGLMSDIQKRQEHTLVGSIVFVLLAFIILTIFTEIAWGYILFISIVLAIVEYVSKRGSDNLMIPIAAGILLLLF